MSYKQQIRILEEKLKQLRVGTQNSENILRVLQIQSEIKKMRKLEWEENHERIRMDEHR